MARSALHRVGRWSAGIVAVPVAAILAYLLAAVVGGSIPGNADWRQAGEGVRIHVADNGIHTDLILPVAAAGVDWRAVLSPDHLRDPRQAGHSHVMFGWGDRDFYLNTPTWWDMRADRVGRALVGLGDTVLHVDHVPMPSAAPHIRSVILTPDEYRRLAAYVAETFAAGPVVRGYGDSDAFYPANGGYSLFRTCNQWTGDALREAGIRFGVWTPLPFTVMWWL